MPMYDNTGLYYSVAGLIVAALSTFGFVVDNNTIVTVIAGVVALYGIIKQAVNHKKMAIAAGAIEK